MDASTLAKHYAVDGPFVTIYLATPEPGVPGAPGGNGQAPAHGVGALLRYAG